MLHNGYKKAASLLTLHCFHNFVIILLRVSHTVAWTSVPSADGFLHVVFWVTVLLYEQEHLFRFCYAESVFQGIALFVALLLKYFVALFNQNGRYLHCSAGVAANCFRIALAFHLDDGVYHSCPVIRGPL